MSNTGKQISVPKQICEPYIVKGDLVYFNHILHSGFGTFERIDDCSQSTTITYDNTIEYLKENDLCVYWLHYIVCKGLQSRREIILNLWRTNKLRKAGADELQTFIGENFAAFL